MGNATCAVDGCDRKRVTRGWCDMHYRRWKRHGDPEVRRPGNGQLLDARPAANLDEQCAIDGCTSRRASRGWCGRHYKRWLRTGDAVDGAARRDDTPCSVDGCERTIRTADMCWVHYGRMRRHGSPTAGRRSPVSAIDFADGTRQCSKCGGRKPLEQFHVSPAGKGGRQAACRDCAGQKKREWYEKNQAFADERARAYRHKRRAVVAKAGFERGLTRALVRERDGDTCAYCGVLMDFNARGRGLASPDRATIDHVLPIHLGGGHVASNVVLCCARCNSSKGAKRLEEWVNRPSPLPGAMRQGEGVLFELISGMEVA